MMSCRKVLTYFTCSGVALRAHYSSLRDEHIHKYIIFFSCTHTWSRVKFFIKEFEIFKIFTSYCSALSHSRNFGSSRVPFPGKTPCGLEFLEHSAPNSHYSQTVLARPVWPMLASCCDVLKQSTRYQCY